MKARAKGISQRTENMIFTFRLNKTDHQSRSWRKPRWNRAEKYGLEIHLRADNCIDYTTGIMWFVYQKVLQWEYLT